VLGASLGFEGASMKGDEGEGSRYKIACAI